MTDNDVVRELGAEIRQLRLQLERDAATYATMQKGMESQSELMDGLKQRVRELETENGRLGRANVALKQDVDVRIEEAAQLRKRLYAVCGK